MKEKITIKEGDKVNVYFDRCDAEFDCEVVYTPAAPGDVFHLKRSDGTPIIVMVFSKMEKIDNNI